jgi:hypothetical protein
MKDVPTRTRSRRRTFLWLLLAVVLVAVWAVISESSGAQAIQEFLGLKHDQLIVNATFSVAPNNFRYYKFSLPADASNFTLVGQFAASVRNPNTDPLKSADAGSDNTIEAFVFSESGFSVWQHGSTPDAVYDSGKIAGSKIQAELPAGAGSYFLIFSNKFSPVAAKNVNAIVSLRHQSRLFEWFHR